MRFQRFVSQQRVCKLNAKIKLAREADRLAVKGTELCLRQILEDLGEDLGTAHISQSDSAADNLLSWASILEDEGMAALSGRFLEVTTAAVYSLIDVSAENSRVPLTDLCWNFAKLVELIVANFSPKREDTILVWQLLAALVELYGLTEPGAEKRILLNVFAMLLPILQSFEHEIEVDKLLTEILKKTPYQETTKDVSLQIWFLISKHTPVGQELNKTVRDQIHLSSMIEYASELTDSDIQLLIVCLSHYCETDSIEADFDDFWMTVFTRKKDFEMLSAADIADFIIWSLTEVKGPMRESLTGLSAELKVFALDLIESESRDDRVALELIMELFDANVVSEELFGRYLNRFYDKEESRSNVAETAPIFAERMKSVTPVSVFLFFSDMDLMIYESLLESLKVHKREEECSQFATRITQFYALISKSQSLIKKSGAAERSPCVEEAIAQKKKSLLGLIAKYKSVC